MNPIIFDLILCQPSIVRSGRIGVDRVIKRVELLPPEVKGIILKWPFPMVKGQALARRALKDVRKEHYQDIAAVASAAGERLVGVYDDCPASRPWAPVTMASHIRKLAKANVDLIGLDHTLEDHENNQLTETVIDNHGMSVAWEPVPAAVKVKPGDWGYQECSPLRPGWGLENAVAKEMATRVWLGARMIAAIVDSDIDADHSTAYARRWLRFGFTQPPCSIAFNVPAWQKQGVVLSDIVKE